MSNSVRLLTLLTAVLLLSCGSLWADEIEWIEDFDQAKKLAAEQGKDLLVDFTGSDWCGWCIRLDKEVFSHDVFKEKAPEKFVLVKLDYPRDKSKMTEDIIKQNEVLAKEYPFPGYPTIYLMDPQGRPYAQTGYQEGGPEKYIEDLDRLVTFKTKRDAALAKRRGTTTMVDGERQRVQPEGLELAKILDEALTAVKPDKTEGALGLKIFQKVYADEIAQIIELDAKNEAGLKVKYDLVMPLPRGQKIEGIWYDALSYDFARELAKKENKLTIIEFTGSDWCPPCIALEKNVFAKEEFHKWAAQNKAVLVRVEYLKKTGYGPGLKEKVDEIRTDFEIKSWPTICILDPEGNELYKNYTFPRGVEGFIEWADEHITKR
ncbi:MAG: thioredoxin fold domain-containing protein [Planctomycetes bacterium]|nr:thioredoxin fold domain-containing protein [Planctomycetota bacterium]